MAAQCPRCSSYWTKSGAEHFNSDFKSMMVISLLTLGAGFIFGVPAMLWRAATKNYKRNRHFCYQCHHQWDV